jgi:hypothetical protein
MGSKGDLMKATLRIRTHQLAKAGAIFENYILDESDSDSDDDPSNADEADEG